MKVTGGLWDENGRTPACEETHDEMINVVLSCLVLADTSQ